MSRDLALLFLRLVAGGSMLYSHGWGKLMRLFTQSPIEFRDPLGVGAPASLGLAAFAEAICSILLIIGLFTRLATVPLIITMLVIIFLVHWTDPFNKIELPLLYLAVYALLAATGPGKYSLDETVRNKVI